MAIDDRFLSGAELYGDDLPPEGLADWFRKEEKGYFDLKGAAAAPPPYEYRALNAVHGFSMVRRRGGACLALGCASGDDVAALASKVDQFVAVEPAREWWRSSIGGRPATYLAPSAAGNLPLATETIDLAVSLGVLHHIPNVSHVLSELARVLKPGGMLILREPINSMGDWNAPRQGLTQNERGLPRAWLRAALGRSGFVVERERVCMFSPLTRLVHAIGVRAPFDSRAFVLLDWAVSSLMAWNDRYHRVHWTQKLAPSSVFVVARKAGGD